jgi:hypothetical protein
LTGEVAHDILKMKFKIIYLQYGKIDRNPISSALKGKGAQIHPATG